MFAKTFEILRLWGIRLFWRNAREIYNHVKG